MILLSGITAAAINQPVGNPGITPRPLRPDGAHLLRSSSLSARSNTIQDAASTDLYHFPDFSSLTLFERQHHELSTELHQRRMPASAFRCIPYNHHSEQYRYHALRSVVYSQSHRDDERGAQRNAVVSRSHTSTIATNVSTLSRHTHMQHSLDPRSPLRCPLRLHERGAMRASVAVTGLQSRSVSAHTASSPRTHQVYNTLASWAIYTTNNDVTLSLNSAKLSAGPPRWATNTSAVSQAYFRPATRRRPRN